MTGPREHYRPRHQRLGIAREDRGDGDGRFDSGGGQRLYGMPTFFDRGAVGFEDPADVFAIGRDRETDAKAGAGGERLQQLEIADNQRPPGLDDKHARRRLATACSRPGIRHFSASAG